MNDQLLRVKNDLHAIEGILGLDVWTERDIRRGMIGNIIGGSAGLLLAAWLFAGGSPLIGLTVLALTFGVILILKDLGFRRHNQPTPGTAREINFYNRFYGIGATVIGCYYIWGQKMEIEAPVLFASTVIFSGLWYMLYAMSAPNRSTSLIGAGALTACGFALPLMASFSSMVLLLGLAACLGCWLEAAATYGGLHRHGAH